MINERGERRVGREKKKRQVQGGQTKPMVVYLNKR